MSAILYVGSRNYSSWSLRGALLVRQSGIPCEEVVILGASLGPLGPSRRVPALHVDGLVIWDTLAIAEFLNEEHPAAGIWPRDRRARARARSVSAEIHSGFVALRTSMPMDIRGRRTVPVTSEVQADIARIAAMWTDCRAVYGTGGDYLFGHWCAADAMYAPVVTRLRTYGIELSAAARRYSDAVWEWPALKSLVAEAATEPWSADLGS
jgi:glutathione S-transferase